MVLWFIWKPLVIWISYSGLWFLYFHLWSTTIVFGWFDSECKELSNGYLGGVLLHPRMRLRIRLYWGNGRPGYGCGCNRWRTRTPPKYIYALQNIYMHIDRGAFLLSLRGRPCASPVAIVSVTMFTVSPIQPDPQLHLGMQKDTPYLKVILEPNSSIF